MNPADRDCQCFGRGVFGKEDEYYEEFGRGRARWDENERNKKRACVISGKSVNSSLRSGQNTHPGRVKFRDIRVNSLLFVEIQARQLEIPAKELEMPAKELEILSKELEMPAKEREILPKELGIPAEERGIPAEELEIPAKERETTARELK